MSTAPVRAAMVPVTRRMRAYFAPVNRANETAAVFDPGKYGLFALDQPPAPWIDLGWIDNFQRFCATVSEPIRAGLKGAPSGQLHGPVDARVEFDFREWGKLQMALAGGSEHMNVLASDPNAAAQASGGTPLAATAVLAGSSASEIVVGAGAVDAFAAGDVVAVEVDYQQQTGYVGSGIAAAYVSDPADVNRDANYVRRVTFNVGRVAEKTTTSLLLAQPLLGGVPAAGAAVQKVIAFVDREGGSFYQEWSGLFVAEEESGGRVCFHYPRLSPTVSIQSSIRLNLNTTSQVGSARVFQREEDVEVAKPVAAIALRAAFLALAYTDANDGQTVVCYRSYFPAKMAGVY
ncbi:MAG TPA: hypothetical protein VLV49_17790 [Terriglobales bacterium]|nr:hypothetical protein [Terriglobales bacterium]